MFFSIGIFEIDNIFIVGVPLFGPADDFVFDM